MTQPPTANDPTANRQGLLATEYDTVSTAVGWSYLVVKMSFSNFRGAQVCEREWVGECVCVCVCVCVSE